MKGTVILVFSKLLVASDKTYQQITFSMASEHILRLSSQCGFKQNFLERKYWSENKWTVITIFTCLAYHYTHRGSSLSDREFII